MLLGQVSSGAEHLPHCNLDLLKDNPAHKGLSFHAYGGKLEEAGKEEEGDRGSSTSHSPIHLLSSLGAVCTNPLGALVGRMRMRGG